MAHLQNREGLLLEGMADLRVAAGEEAVTKLVQGNRDEREAMWLLLMKSGDAAIHEALANILIGLGIEVADVEGHS